MRITTDEIDATIIAEKELEKMRKRDGNSQPLYVELPESRDEPSAAKKPVRGVIVIEF